MHFQSHQGGSIKSHSDAVVTNKELVPFCNSGIRRLPSTVTHDKENLNTPYKSSKTAPLRILTVRLSGRQSEQHNFQIS